MSSTALGSTLARRGACRKLVQLFFDCRQPRAQIDHRLAAAREYAAEPQQQHHSKPAGQPGDGGAGVRPGQLLRQKGERRAAARRRLRFRAWRFGRRWWRGGSDDVGCAGSDGGETDASGAADSDGTSVAGRSITVGGRRRRMFWRIRRAVFISHAVILDDSNWALA